MTQPDHHADKPHTRALDGDSPTGSTGRLADRIQTLARLSSEALGDKVDEEDDAQAHKRRKVEETGEEEPRWVPQRSNVQNCDGCRSRKTKCDRSRPCGNCRLRGKACTYSHSQLDPLNSSRLDKNLADTIRLKQHAFMLARRLGLLQVELEDLSRLADRLFDDEAKRTLPKGMWLPFKRPLVEVLRTRDASRRVTVLTGAPPSSSPPVPSAHGPPRAAPPSSRPAPPPPPPPAPPRYHGYDVAASWSSLQQARQDEPAPQPVDRPESTSPPPPLPRPHKDGDDSAFTSVPLEHAPRLFGARASAVSSSSAASGLVGSAPGPPTWASVAQPPPPRPPPSLPPHKPFSPSLAPSMTPAQRASTPTLPPLAIPALAYRSMHLSSAVTTLSSAYSPLRTASTASTTPASAAPSASACFKGDAASNLPPPFRLSPPRSTTSRSPSPPSTAPKVSRPRLAGFASLSAIAGLGSPSSRGKGPSGDDRRSSVLPPLRLPSMLHGEQ